MFIQWEILLLCEQRLSRYLQTTFISVFVSHTWTQCLAPFVFHIGINSFFRISSVLLLNNIDRISMYCTLNKNAFLKNLY